MGNIDENTRRIMAYNNSLTPEERRKRAVENGKRSGEARKKRKTWRESVQMVMAGALDLEHATAIKEQLHLDAEPEELTQQDAVIAAITEKAKRGDRDCAAFLRDTAGESPQAVIKLGNLDDKTFQTLDLGGMTDEELRRVMERERPEEDTITIDSTEYVVADS